jgi:hypothetical protein
MVHRRLATSFVLLFLASVLATTFVVGSAHSAAAAPGVVTTSAPDFSLSANPTSQTIKRGGNAFYDIHVDALNGFNGTVNFTFTGRPNHESGFFSGPVTGSGDTTFHMHSAGHQSPIGTFKITVIGTSGALQHTVQVLYTVTF